MDDKTLIQFPNDNTVIRPRPGGKRNASLNTGSVPQQENYQRRLSENHSVSSTVGYSQPARDILPDYRQAPDSDSNVPLVSTQGLNELVHCLSTLLSLMIKLSNTALHKDVNQLKYKLQDEIKQFEICAGKAGISNDKILQARYVICTSLDEIVVSTPWGQESNWSQQSLLSIFHGETWGGEKFFLLLQRLLKEPIKNLDLMELMYICMSLGFQGKYRVIDNGLSEVEHLREDLYRQLRSLKNDFNKELSSHWHGVSDARGALIRYVPLWVVGALSGVILLAMFSSFTYMLGQSSTPVMKQIINLGPEKILPLTEGVVTEPDEQQTPERFVRPPQNTSQQPTQSTGLNIYLLQGQVYLSGIINSGKLI